MKRILLAVGALTWDRLERVTDRYGMVTVHEKNSLDEIIDTSSHMRKAAINSNVGKVGELIFVVTGTRDSTHIGDMTHGIFPSTPEVGKEIKLGEGTLIKGETDWCTTVGLKPLDNRKRFWLNPEALYNAHEQSGNLYFIDVDS